jgi:hypothetical protein
MWTRFRDMHSGGGCKEKPFETILIEAQEAEAKVIFYNRFGHNPERVTCTCCGEDYSINSHESLSQITAFDRGCRYEGSQWIKRPDRRYHPTLDVMPLNDYLSKAHLLVIRAEEIKPSERQGDVPQQGYVWAGG